jgi:hypothetical protein
MTPEVSQQSEKEGQRQLFVEIVGKGLISRTKEALANNEDFAETLIEAVLEKPNVLTAGMYFRTKGKNYYFSLNKEFVRLYEWKRLKQREGFRIQLYKDQPYDSHISYYDADGKCFEDGFEASQKIDKFLKQF